MARDVGGRLQVKQVMPPENERAAAAAFMEMTPRLFLFWGRRPAGDREARSLHSATSAL